jgi:hypothetical protein
MKQRNPNPLREDVSESDFFLEQPVIPLRSAPGTQEIQPRFHITIEQGDRFSRDKIVITPMQFQLVAAVTSLEVGVFVSKREALRLAERLRELVGIANKIASAAEAGEGLFVARVPCMN